MSFNTVIILAAGAGTRMKSKLPKVLHPVCGKPMVAHVIDVSRAAEVDNITVVIGNGAEQVKEALKQKNVDFAYQTEQLGTGHAVMQAADSISKEGVVFVLCGDTPLITTETLKKMEAQHISQGNTITILTAVVDNPFGYGRILRSENGIVEKIVEQKDASEAEKKVNEINAGMYCFDGAFLKSVLPKLDRNNAQNEYYITDAISKAVNSGMKVGAYVVEDADEIMGVNTRVQLAAAESVMRRRIIEKHMLSGVSFVDPNHAYIDETVEIGQDSVIYPGVILKGNTVIGQECTIGQNSRIENSTVGNGTEIESSVLLDCIVGDDTKIGPYAYLRPKSKVGNKCRIGDFVEVKNSVIGDGSKAAHLAYVGDADVGRDVNIGCGVVFVNYDGVNKHRSTAKDRSFIGSNVNLVAPVTIEEDAYVAAGTTVSGDVPSGALCVGRAKEKHLEGWVERRGLLKRK